MIVLRCFPHRMVQVAISALLVAGLSLGVSPGNAADFSGQTVSLMINFPAGTSTDVFARQLAPVLKKKLPGNPNVTIINKPGGALLLGPNFFYKQTKPDGKTVGMFVAIIFPVAINKKGVQFDLDKMELLGTESTNQVVLFHKDTGIRKAEDLLKIKKQLFVGTSSKVNISYANNVAFLRVLGVPYKGLTGYRGQARLLQAMRAGELSMAQLSWRRYMSLKESLEKEGIFVPLFQRGRALPDGRIVREEILGVPTAQEVVKKIKPSAVGSPEWDTLNTFGSMWSAGVITYWLPPGASGDLIDTWRKGLNAAYADPEFGAAYKKRTKGLTFNYFDRPDAKKMIAGQITTLREPRIKAVVNKIFTE